MKIDLSQNAPVEIFPFVTAIHREVVLRHHDGESQDVEMTPDEADQVADLLRQAAARARDLPQSTAEEDETVPRPLVDSSR